MRANKPGADTAVVLELPAAQAASLGQWLRCAAVVFEICASGVRVDVRGNRVFAYGHFATLVREWMQAQRVDAVFASFGDVFFSITREPHLTHQRPRSGETWAPGGGGGTPGPRGGSGSTRGGMLGLEGVPLASAAPGLHEV